MTRSAEATPQPVLLRRAAVVAHFPLGIAVTTARYLWWHDQITSTEEAGDDTDLPPPLPPELVDELVKTAQDGAGALLHRRFRVHIRGSRVDAAALIARLTTDLDRAAPSEVVSFRKERGRLGDLEVGDEYRVRMPAPWDGPVRVVHRTPTSFRFATLSGHLEAGQVEFRARDAGDGLTFEIETWSRPGDRVARIVFEDLKIGKEIQLHMWSQVSLAMVSFDGGVRDGDVTAHTRRRPWAARTSGDPRS